MMMRSDPNTDLAPSIVLVEPQLGENIGTAARAMANFGLSDLRLVSPRDGWPNKKAEAAASGATWILEGAQIFDSLSRAISDCVRVYATTARTRDMPKSVSAPADAIATLREFAGAGHPTAILFGREKWGLTNEEVTLADEIITFPVNPRFASLNIAQAVLLMSYQWMLSGLKSGELPTRIEIAERTEAPATKDEVIRLMEHLETALDRAGYFTTPHARAAKIEKLRALIQRRRYTGPEIQVLRGVIAALDGQKGKRTDNE